MKNLQARLKLHKKTQRFELLLTEAEKKLLYEHSVKEGVSASETVRIALNKYLN